VLATLALTLVGSLAAQVNPFALRYTVDTVQAMLTQEQGVGQGWHLLAWVSAILLGKEVLNAGITFGQKYFGEKIRISVSGVLAETVVQRLLTYQLGYFTESSNQAGRLQTRIDRGVESLMKLVQNF